VLRVLFWSTLFLMAVGLQAQVPSTAKDSSTKNLQEVIVQAYGSNSSSFSVPASIGSVSRSDLQRYSVFNLLPSFNGVSGVRLEERSPGSYRLSIRGSLLRSPFGVRNVKIYYDDFLLTDAGGNTYLNLLDVAAIGKAEIIKGPAGSNYGAGTGGAVLLSSTVPEEADTSTWKVRVGGGSFSTLQESVHYQSRSNGMEWGLTQSHFQSKGYRDHSGIRKDLVQLRAKLQTSASVQTDLLMLYADLNYKTPGGLTLAQQAVNPRQSRPATPTLPSARDQQAQIFNKTLLVGVSNRFVISEKWKLINALTASVTSFKNPFITNYESRKETNLGWRSTFQFDNGRKRLVQWQAGVEWQIGRYEIDSSGNIRGVPDQRRVRDKINADQLFVFSQLRLRPSTRWELQAGLSANSFGYAIDRVAGTALNGKWKFQPQVLPRVAASFIPVDGVAFFVQVAKGFSAPTLAEVKPSAGGLYTGLQAESGWNTETGVRIKDRRGRFLLSSQVFQFDLRNAIVRQVNAGGAEYFINAGKVRQRGWETDASMYLIANRSSFVRLLHLKAAYTRNNFRFLSYAPSGNRYDGNRLTGVPEHTIAFSIASEYRNGLFLNFNINQVGRIPLNDANSFWSDRYSLIQLKTGWKGSWRRTAIEVFLLGDNLGDDLYSLGHDINAFGNRFYNPAPGRNLLLGCSIQL